MSQLRSKWSMALGPITFHARETFTSSVLPSKREVVERMIWFLIPRPKGTVFLTSKEWAASRVSEELCEHWIWCNIYPKQVKNVNKMILNLYIDFKKLQSTPKDRRTDKWVSEKVQPYIKSLAEEGLDIQTLDTDYRKKLEKHYGVKETDMEVEFWEEQMRGRRIGHCDGFVDRKWSAMDARRKKDQESYQTRLEREKEEQVLRFAKVNISDDDLEDSQDDTRDFDYEMEEGQDVRSSKKRRRIVGEADPNNNLELPDGTKESPLPKMS